MTQSFHMPLEPVEDRLPAIALLLDGMGLFGVKRDDHRHGAIATAKFDPRLAVGERIFDQRLGRDFRVGPSEIKAEAAVLGFYPRGKRPAFAQINAGGGRMPIIGRRVPGHDVGRRRIGAPDLRERRGDVGLDDDFHFFPC